MRSVREIHSNASNVKTDGISQLHQMLGNFQPQENFTLVQIKFVLLSTSVTVFHYMDWILFSKMHRDEISNLHRDEYSAMLIHRDCAFIAQTLKFFKIGKNNTF